MHDLHDHLKHLGRWVKLAALFRSAGLNANTMSQKLVRGADFTDAERRAIAGELAKIQEAIHDAI